MQFLLIAYDGTDDEAPARRQAVREAHLETAKVMEADGTMSIGGAILDDQGNMIGSMAVVDMPSREAVDQWLEKDPYVMGDVWQDIKVVPFKTAPMFEKTKDAA